MEKCVQYESAGSVWNHHISITPQSARRLPFNNAPIPPGVTNHSCPADIVLFPLLHGIGISAKKTPASLKLSLRHFVVSESQISHWLVDLRNRKCYNVAVVALVDKTLRVAWAVLKKGENYDLEQQSKLAEKYYKKAA